MTVWQAEALCRDGRALKGARLTADDWFRDTGRVITNQAKDFCLDCPVMFQCRDMARTDGIPSGVFGGEDKKEREDWWAANGGRPTLFDDAIAIQFPRNPKDNEEETDGEVPFADWEGTEALPA